MGEKQGKSLEPLPGTKSYAVAVAGILGAWSGYLGAPGVPPVTLKEALAVTLAGLMAVALRLGIEKAITKTGAAALVFVLVLPLGACATLSSESVDLLRGQTIAAEADAEDEEHSEETRALAAEYLRTFRILLADAEGEDIPE